MTKIQSGIKVTAPAVVSDLNLGSDIIAIALDKTAVEIVIHKSVETGLRIRSISGDKKQLSTAFDKNIASLSAINVWKYLTHYFGTDAGLGIELEIRVKISMNSGLGVYESLATAGAYAMNEFFGSPLDKKELLPLILSAAKSLDIKLNFAAVSSSLMGSCMLVRDVETIDIFRIPVLKGLFFTIIIPDRLELIQNEIKLEYISKQSANLGSFIYAMYNSDLYLISRSLNSSLDNNFIIKFYSITDDMISNLNTRCISYGTLKNSSSLFFLSANSIKAEEINQLFLEHNKLRKIKYQSIISSINYEGCEIM
jgi:homoserine kinase